METADYFVTLITVDEPKWNLKLTLNCIWIKYKFSPGS